MKGTLAGKVALVAGATRGAGRAIAVALGEAGATVYGTGRSSREGPPRPGGAGASPFALAQRPETIEETAQRVTAAGGRGVAVRCDHTDPAQVMALVARIRAEQGRLDVLVNDVWGGDELSEWGRPFWQLSLEKGLAMLQRAVHSHLITARLAVPLMLERGAGLVVEITDGDGAYYRGTLFYDLAKLSVIRLAFAMAEELRPHGIAALAVTPGFLRSEAMLEHFGVTEATWREGAAQDPNFLASETPAYVGRAVAALAADPGLAAKSGGLFSSWGLQAEYGYTDADGTRPDWGAHAAGRDFAAEQRASHARYLAAFAAYEGRR
jgi:NAD(P)-dependent dehydrogenase (short-subunit alcohol dehydrogenase family)